MERTASDYEKLDKLMDYEEKNIPAKQIVLWVGGLLVGLVLVMLGMYFIVGVPQAIPRPDVVANRKMLQPTLQRDPASAMRKFKREQNEYMNSYGWVNKQQGVVHIPIEAAMEMAIQRGMFPRGASEEVKK